jgi:hypothetical protein
MCSIRSQALISLTVLVFAMCRRAVHLVGSCTINDLHPTIWSSIFLRLINIKNTDYVLSGAQLCYKFLVRTPLYTCGHRPTGTNVSYDKYLLAPKTN